MSTDWQNGDCLMAVNEGGGVFLDTLEDFDMAPEASSLLGDEYSAQAPSTEAFTEEFSRCSRANPLGLHRGLCFGVGLSLQFALLGLGENSMGVLVPETQACVVEVAGELLVKVSVAGFEKVKVAGVCDRLLDNVAPVASVAISFSLFVSVSDPESAAPA